jgi:hypothetical protein
MSKNRYIDAAIVYIPVLYGFRGGRSSQFGHENSHYVEEENKVYLPGIQRHELMPTQVLISHTKSEQI